MSKSIEEALKELAAKVKGSGTAADISADSIAEAIAALTAEYENYTLPAATLTKMGGVKKAANQTASTATDAAGLVADFNALLAKLKVAGIVTADS